jgi:type I restriction enzyme S subunit
MFASNDEILRYGVRQGDVLVAEGGDVGRAVFAPRVDDDTILQNSLHRLRGDPDVLKFVRYCLEAVRDAGWLDVLTNRATFGHLTREKLTALRIPWPAPGERCVIADLLDAETSHLDRLIKKRQTMVELLQERRTVLVEEVIRKAARAHGVLPLKRAVWRIEVGIVITPSIWYADDGVVALRGVNVRRGQIILDDVVRISDEGHLVHHKSALRAGDVVVVRTGQAGAAAVIPRELDGANCIDLVIVRPGSVLLPEFLEFVLNSDWSQKHIQEYSVGTIQSHFNVGAMKALPVPLPTLEEQQRIVDDLTQATAELDDVISKMRRQIALLKERRQALITAAVTGELDVTKGAA